MAKKTNTTFSEQQRLALKITALALIVLLFGIWMWYRFVFSGAEKTFWDTVDANLKTYGVTRNITQEQQGTNVDRYIQLQFGNPSVVRDISTITQESEKERTRVVSEVLGTLDANYIRYRELDNTKQGQTRDFAGVENVWAKQEITDDNRSEEAAFRDAIIGPIYAVPFAQLPEVQRAEFVAYIKDSNVYNVDFDRAVRKQKDGRDVYEYTVKTNVPAYIEMVKRLDSELGLNQLQDLDARQYAGQPDVEIIMTIDVHARQITEVNYSQVGQVEVLSGYGARIIDELPEATMTRAELEKQLQNVLQ